MIPARLLCLAGALLPAASSPPRAAAADAKVELVVLGEKGAGLEFQQWMQTLNKVGAARVQLRSRQPTDRVGIESQGSPDRPVYVVTATLNGQGELVVPGAQFRRGESGALARWIAELAERGPPAQREAVVGLGLTARQLSDARTELARPLGFSTAGRNRAEVARQIAAQLGGRASLGSDVLQALGEETLAEELSSLSCGTALAYVVRSAGLAVVPVAAGGQIRYTVGAARPGQEVWPIGWKPEKLPKETVPLLFEFLNVNIQGVTASKAVEALGKRLQVPLLLDHNAMARHGVDLDKVTVNLPAGKSTYSLILQKVLFQARLKYEVRADEAGTPLLWITTVKPL